jgi:hypothetical protein
LINKSLKSRVVDVKRCGDRIILVKQVFGDLVRSVPSGEKLFIGGDLNGQVGASNTVLRGVHGGFGYGIRNQEGEDVLSFGLAYDMIVANTLFKKRESHLVTLVVDNIVARLISSSREERQRCVPRLQGDSCRECCPSA